MKSNKRHIELASRDFCTGCAVCVNVCPKGCISMVEGVMGHMFPHIDNAKCIKCEKCVKICPALRDIDIQPIQKAWAAWTKNDTDYRSSSSGGIATLLSKYIIQQGGVVYGCSMQKGIDVNHIRVDNEQDVELLKKSKYVQSNIVDIFQPLLEDVKAKRLVLFIGTPCQTSAVKGLFLHCPDNLLLVDLVCHGVPSQRLLKDYVKSIVGNDIKDLVVTFRKNNQFYFTIEKNSENLYQKKNKCDIIGGDWYMGTFMKGYTCRDSCTHCYYAQPNRVSDLTIGDFWGLGSKLSTAEIPDHTNGCSVILSVSGKGRRLIEAIRPYINLYERPVSEAIEGNEQLQRPISLNRKIKFYRLVNRSFSCWNLYYIVHYKVFWNYYKDKVVRKVNKIRKNI